MGIPVGTTFTATLRARAMKHVTCEKCSDAYVYVVERKGVGQGFSPLWLDNAGATRRAEQTARRALDKAIAVAVEPIGCLRCGHLQESMVREARRRRGKWWVVLAWIAGGVAVLTVLITWAGTGTLAYTSLSATGWHVAGIAALIAVVALTVRRLTATEWNPNTDTLWKRRRAAANEGKALRKEEFDRLANEPPSRSAP